MNLIIAVACAVLIMMVAKGLYSLQWWLEHSDYQRHFED